MPLEKRRGSGRDLGEAVPHSSHARFQPAEDRRDPVDILERQAASRVAELIPIRYGRMLMSPFAFYRGSAAIMAEDLANTPNTGLNVQLCGDAHLGNFGVFGSPERRLVGDLNDFDETARGPFEWDLKRLSASFSIAGHHNGLSLEERTTVMKAVSRRYLEAMRDFAGRSNLDVWYASLSANEILDDLRSEANATKRATKIFDKARTRDNLQALNKLTTVVKGERRILADPPLLVPVEDLPGADAGRTDDLVREVLEAYSQSLQPDRAFLLSQYRYVHAAHKVVGVGSVGTRAFVVLLQGIHHGDPLLLQVKEAQPSVLEGHLGSSPFENHGQRVVLGQRMMQAASDVFLGWTRLRGSEGITRDFYVRQLRDWKGSPNLERMGPDNLIRYGQICGWILARAHARSGDRISIAEYLGEGDGFVSALAEFGEAYANQNELDYKQLSRAAEEGRITVASGYP